MKKTWQGIGASPGYSVGKTWSINRCCDQNPVEEMVFPVNAESELECFERSIKLTDKALVQYEQQVLKEKGEELARIFAAHRILLNDPAFTGEICRLIQDKSYKAENAIKQVTEETVNMLNSLDDPYFRARTADIQDVSRQLVENLNGNNVSDGGFPQVGNWVVVAEELTPAQTISLPKDRVLAFIVHKGGKTSHAAILARTYGIPAVIGLDMSWNELAELESVEVDGDEGWVRELSFDELQGIIVGTADKEKSEISEEDLNDTGVILAANIGSPSDLPLVKRFKAQGVGLYRTEFLFMGSNLPTEEEQVAAYSKVIAECAPNLTVIRTLDIGGDKRAPALNLPEEKNPFLGVRALRLCFKKPELFNTQLRAIWRSSAKGPTAVMFPMIATLEELLKAKEYLFKARDEIINEGYEVGNLQVGMMIEIPAAAWIAPRLAKEIDFFSIGTNDLVQYSLAADRENNTVADLYQPYHPAVLGMIARVAWAANEAGKWTGICGEAGGDSLLTPFFAWLGIKELSMAPGLLPKVRETLAKLDMAVIEKANIIEEILASGTCAEVKNILQSLKINLQSRR